MLEWSFELYRMTLVVSDPGRVDMNFLIPPSCLVAKPLQPNFHQPRHSWADCHNPSQPNPGPRPPVSPCSLSVWILRKSGVLQEMGKGNISVVPWFPWQLGKRIVTENFRKKWKASSERYCICIYVHVDESPDVALSRHVYLNGLTSN